MNYKKKGSINSMKKKERWKRLLVLGLAAGMIIDSIPIHTYAAGNSSENSGMTVMLEEQTQSQTAEQPEADTADEELGSEGTAETDTEEENGNTSETEKETDEETITETENAEETVAEIPEKEETETESVLETETEKEAVSNVSAMEKQIEEMESQAKEVLKSLTASEYIMALVYLCDSYEVKTDADRQSQTADSLNSGQTVFIRDVEVDAKSRIIWYQISLSAEDSAKTGYINREYLAYSNESFLAWEEAYIEPIQLFMDGNQAGEIKHYSDGAVNAYSSDVEQFPSSYQNALQTLKNSHPNWTFVKFDTGLNWNDVVYNELNPKARSLVYYTKGAAWKNGVYEKDSKWYYASEAAVRYCLDPRNGLTDPRIFQFEQLTYNSSYHSVSAIQNILNSTFMKGNVPKGDNSGNTISYAQAFYNIGKARTLSPFHLASRVIQEQGVNGNSPLISGTYSGYEGYYNYFNVGATSENPIVNGLKYAKEKGWNTPYKSMEGGADTIGKNYILQGQDTLYLQKFDVESKYNGLYAHQYMQNIQAPTTESSTIRNLYNQAGALNGNFVFKIPVYNNMPAVACAEPSSESITLSSNEVSLKGGYSVDITYSINDKNSSLSSCVPENASIASAIKVKDSEKADNANNKVTGTITIEGLAPGATYITMKTTNGATATCKVTVIKDTITLSKTTAEVSAGSSDGSLPGIPTEITYKINNPKSGVEQCSVESLEADKKAVLTAELIKGEVDGDNNLTGSIRLTGIAPGKAKVTLTSRYGGTQTCTVTVVRLPEEAIMTTKEITIGIGDSKNAHVTILPEDTTNKNLTWSSSDEKVAVVNADSGSIIGVSEGTATITGTTQEVTLKTGEPLTVTCTITVVPAIEGVEIAAKEIELSLKEQETFALDGKLIVNGTIAEDLYRIEYVSADEEIVVVDENGIITPKAAGSTVVTASVKNPNASSGTKSASCRVNVVPEKRTEASIPDYEYVQPEEIQIYKKGTEEEVTANTYAQMPLKSGGMAVLEYVISPVDADVEKVTWVSSKPAVARVEDNGDGTAAIYAGTKGNAVITVTTDIGIQKQLNVVVEEKQKMTEVTLDKAEAVLYVNGTVSGNDGLSSQVQLHAEPKALPENGIAYEWSSTEETVAEVDENGTVTAKAPGKTTIVAKDAGGSGKYAQCEITVERYAESITASVDELYVQPKKKVTVTVQYMPEDYTAAKLEWSSSNKAVAEVTQTGVVTVQKNAAPGEKAIISVKDHISGIAKEIPLTVTQTAAKNVVLYETDTDKNGNAVKASAKTLYVNGAEQEQSTVVKAEGLDAANRTIENISFYAVSSNKKAAEVVPIADAAGKYDGSFKIIAKGKGSADIKVYAADGSGKSVSLKVTVQVYPEQICIPNEAMYLAPGGSGNLEAVVKPSDAAEKEVVWKFAGGRLKSYAHTENGFILNPNTGEVTVQNGTEAGTKAEFAAVNKASGIESETTCTVTVVSQAVTKVKTEETSVILAGETLNQIPEKQLHVQVSPVAADSRYLKYTSSDEEIVTVNTEGRLKAVGYGTASVTVATWDNKSKAVCKVYVTPAEKSCKLSAVEKNINIQSYALDINSSYQLQIKDQNGKVYDNSLFTFTSSKPEIVHTDANGVVTPAVSYEGAKNGKASVTAVLKNDPYKRKVTFQVTVLTKEQAETVSVAAMNIRGENILNTDFAVKYPTEQILLKAEAFNAYGESVETKLKWSVSDSSMAGIQASADAKSAVLTVKKAGKFYITCTAQDSLKKSRKIQITAVDAKPVLEQKKITLNVQSESDEASFVQSEQFHIAADKSCPIQKLTVKSAEKNQIQISASDIEIKEVKNGYYVLQMPESSMKKFSKGTYNVILSAEVKGLTELGMEEKLVQEIPVALNIVDRKPKISIGTVTFNRQILSQSEAGLQIKASDKVESIVLEANQYNHFDTRFGITEENGIFKLKFADHTGYDSDSITGKALVKVEGYRPQTVNITVKTPSKKVAVAVSNVPAMDMKRGREQKVSLYNKETKETLKNYNIELPQDAKLNIVKNSDGTLTISPIAQMQEKDQYKNGSTVTVTAKVMALSEDGTEELWKEKVSVNISVKAYTATPTVALGAATIQLNRQTAGEKVETAIRINRDNVRVADDSEWRIEQYDTRNKEYTVIKDWGELPENTRGNIILAYDREKQMLCTSIRKGSEVYTGTYKYRITWIAEDYSLVEGNVTVVVTDRVPTAKITSKGKLDLLNRADSDLQGTIQLTNTCGNIQSITLLESAAGNKRNENFYSTWLGNNTFRIRLREGAVMTTGKKTVPVKLVLEGGAVIYSTVSFKVSQSTPKVTAPKTQTIYKSGSNTTVCFDMNMQIADGYEINTIQALFVPDGIGTIIENGRVWVSLADRHIKPGTYSIKVNLYFKGAQNADGNSYGKAVQTMFKVTVK